MNITITVIIKMKKLIFAILLSSSILISFSQDISDDKLYIYINNKSFWPALLGYKAVLGIKSNDERFSHDNYYFKISYRTLDYQSLYSLGEAINIDTLDYIKDPIEHFKDLTVCELHTKLSLYNQVFIISEIPESKLELLEDKSKRYIMWSAQYSGTNKDVTWVNPGKKPLIEN